MMEWVFQSLALMIIAKMEKLVNSTILITAALFVGIAALVVVFTIWMKIRKLSRFQNEFFKGKGGTDLEGVIIAHNEQLHRIISDLRGLEKEYKELAVWHEKTIQKVGFVRFNSFGEKGGDSSFCLAFLDAVDSGVVITSLYGRETQRIYVKKIEKGVSKIPLTEEEKQAIMESREAFLKEKENDSEKTFETKIRRK